MKFKPTKLRGQTIRAKRLWIEWWTKLQENPDLTVPELASQYINQKTGKTYNRATVYYGLKRLEELTA